MKVYNSSYFHVVQNNCTHLEAIMPDGSQYFFTVEGLHFTTDALISAYKTTTYGTERGLANLRMCIAEGSYHISRDTSEQRHRIPASGICCRTEFELDRFTNTCPDCGTDYSSSGEQLADRSVWGEETGEQWCDIQDL